MTNSNLQAILGNNVVELTFVRRHPKLGWSNVRGLFGTTNFPLLNGQFGSQVLHFVPPKGVGMGYDYKKYNLCVVWDMFRQEYRVFGAEQVQIRKQFDLSTPEAQTEFEQYFYDYIINMSQQDKLDFIGYVGESVVASQLSQQEAQKAASAAQANTAPTKEKPLTNRITNIYGKIKNFASKFFSKKD